MGGNYTALLFLQVANYVLPLLILPFLVRVLGTEKFGLVMFAQALCTVLNVLVDFGFGLSATRRISLVRDDKEYTSLIFSSVLAAKFMLLIGAFLILLILIFTFTRFSNDPQIYLLSFGVLVGQALLPDWFFQGIEKMRFITIVNVIAKTIFTLLVFFLVKTKTDYLNVPMFNSIGYIAAGILSLLVSLKYTKLVRPSKKMIVLLFNESWSLFVSNLAARLFNSANIIILGLIAGDSLAGIYASMEKLVVALKSFFSPLYQAVYPWLSKQTRKGQIVIIKKMAIFVFGLSAFFAIITLLFGGFILEVVFDDKDITSYAAIFKITSLSMIFSALNMLIITLFLPAARKYAVRMYILVGGGLFHLVFGIVLTFYFGIYGTAISAVATELALLIAAWYYFYKDRPAYVR